MQMVGKYHDCIDDERTLSARRTQSVAKQFDVIHERFGASVSESDREEKCSAGHEVTPIVDHPRIISRLFPAYRSAHAGYDRLPLPLNAHRPRRPLPKAFSAPAQAGSGRNRTPSA